MCNSFDVTYSSYCLKIHRNYKNALHYEKNDNHIRHFCEKSSNLAFVLYHNRNMMMRDTIKIGACLTVIVLIFSGCGGLKNKTTELCTDSVALRTVNVIDTTSYMLGNALKCSVTAEAAITFPDGYKDESSTVKLQSLFSSSVLEVNGDSIVLPEAFHRFAKNVLDQYGEDVDEVEYDKDEHVVVYKYNSKTSIKPVYNKNGIISFCKEEVTRKNDKVTMNSHTFINISLNSMSVIELANLFPEESIGDVSDLLKRRLLQQLDAKDETDLIDMGYFNLDNLVANNNFSIGDEGITWIFGIYDIACYSVGETMITLNYEMLKPYMIENNEIADIIN